jgi:uncharacterized membrane protein
VDLYLLLKFVHVLLAIFALGSNLTYGMWMAAAGGDRQRIAFAIDGIRRVDRVANIGYVLLLVTGLTLVFTAGIPLMTFWIAAALGLYVGAVVLGAAFYAPAIRQQATLLASAGPASPQYRAVAARANALGIATTVDVMLIVFLMVVKPTL